MIIGIFGDSFADGHGGNPVSWTKLLETTYSFDIKNYARSSSSTFWSYRKLLSAIDKIDTIVFVLTDSIRLYHPKEKYQRACTLFTAQHFIKTASLSGKELAVYKAAEQYHIHLADCVFHDFVQDQVVKEVQALAQQHDKKLIIVPAYPYSVKYQTIFKTPLVDILWKELSTNFGNRFYRSEKMQLRCNHMSKENNKVLAEKMAGILTGKITSIALDDFIFTKYDDPGLHWYLDEEST